MRARLRAAGAAAVLLFLLGPLSAPAGEAEDDEAGGVNPAWEDPFAGTGGKVDGKVLREVLDCLRGIENLAIRVLPQGAILTGELLTTEDLQRVGQVAGRVPGIVNLCRLDPEALKVAAAHLEREIEAMGILGLSLRPVGGRLVLLGAPSSPEEAGRVRALGEALGLSLVDGTTAGGGDPSMVLFEVCFTEVNRQAFRDLGVSWPSSLALHDPSGARFDRLTFAASLEATLRLMVQRGEGRILSRPRLLCRSGDSASFLAGGEIPIPQRNREGEMTVLWKHYGIILEVSPRVDAKGVIRSRIDTEVSMVDRANAVEGIPGVLTRRVGTSLALAPGQTVSLSGLVNTEEAEQVQGVPLLSAIPILGELFRSRSFQRRETELVVFLTPRLVSCGGPGEAPGLPSRSATVPLP